MTRVTLTDIAVGRAVRAPADGYTLNLGQLGSHVMNGAAYDLPYDLVNDLDPVSLIAANPHVIVARSGMPVMERDQGRLTARGTAAS